MSQTTQAGHASARKLTTGKLLFKPQTYYQAAYINVGNIIKYKFDWERKAAAVHKTAERGWKFIDDEIITGIGLKLILTVDEHWAQIRRFIFGSRSVTTSSQSALVTPSGTSSHTSVTQGKAYSLGKRKVSSLIVYHTQSCVCEIDDDTITCAAHGFSNGDAVSFATTGALPTGLVAGTTYYVRDKADDTFKVAATLGGDAIDLTGADGTGNSVRKACTVTTDYTLDANAGMITIVCGGGITTGWNLVTTFSCALHQMETYEPITGGVWDPTVVAVTTFPTDATIPGDFIFFENQQGLAAIFSALHGSGTMWVSNDGENNGNAYNEFELTLRVGHGALLRTRL